MNIYRYELREEMYFLPIQLRVGDKVNARELFMSEAERQGYVVEDVIWRADNDGVYGELYLRDSIVK